MFKYKYSDGDFDIKKATTSERGDYESKEEALADVAKKMKEISLLQNKLYADGKEGLIVVFQAMDAAGKDSSIKAVFSGINPQGISVHSFKQPTGHELAHDYLWRYVKRLPTKGKIAVFNRSYYEDVLVVKVRKLYENFNLPERIDKEKIIDKRYKEIVNFENYLYDNGTRILKFFLHISKDEQKKRFLSRIDDEHKNWKFSESDLKERALWDDYQEAYEDAINATATKKCPWYIIPTDRKWYAKALMSDIVLKTLKDMNPQYPPAPDNLVEHLEECRRQLEGE